MNYHYIEENNYDKNYPFVIKDAWNGMVCFKIEDLIKLNKEIEEILKENKKLGKKIMEEYIAGLDLSPYIEGEIWKDIPNYEGYYQVSNIGRVRSLDRIVINSLGRKYYYKGKILKQHFKHSSKQGYLRVVLVVDGAHKPMSVHRLVAFAFVFNDDPINKNIVNHKDENPSNNKVENLEWCTVKYNNNYGTGLIRRAITRSREIIQLTKDNNIVKIYDSATKAEKYFGYSQRHISNCCVGTEKQSAGYKWMFLKDYKPELTEKEVLYYKNTEAPECKDVRGRTIVKLSIDNIFIKQYNTIAEAQKDFNHKTGAGHIVSCCKNERKTAYGYKWMYLEDYEKFLKNNRNNT